MKSIRLDPYDTASFLNRIGVTTIFDINAYDPVQESIFEMEVAYLYDRFDHDFYSNYSEEIKIYNHSLKLDSQGCLTITQLQEAEEYDYDTLF